MTSPHSSSRQLFLATLVSVIALPSFSFDTVVIDPGHGGKDPGSMWNKLVEKKICLDVAQRLNTELKSKGFQTVMTRTTDVFVELADRPAMARAHPQSIFVSIHFNASRDKSAKGFETHYLSEKGLDLATSIQASMKKKVPGVSRGVTKEDYKVLRESPCTAVLVECGFISNKNEASDCGSWKHRQMLAQAIAEGIAAMKDKL